MCDKHTMLTETIQELSLFLSFVSVFSECIDSEMSVVKAKLIGFVIRNCQGGCSSIAYVDIRCPRLWCSGSKRDLWLCNIFTVKNISSRLRE